MGFLKKFRRAIRFRALLFAVRALSFLPIDPACALGAAVGITSYYIAGRERRMALENLARAFPQMPDAQRRRVARRCFTNLGRSATEIVIARRLDSQLRERVNLPEASRATLEAAVAERRGVIFVTAHLGNWELLARRIALDFDTRTVAREAADARITALLERTRQAGGVRTLWRGRPGVAREILRTLREGALLGLLVDQDIPKVHGVFVDFFGYPAWTPRAAADLAHHGPIPAVFGTIHRLGNGRHEIRVERLQLGLDALETTQRFTAAIESEVRRRPEEWVWMHSRWRTKSIVKSNT